MRTPIGERVVDDARPDERRLRRAHDRAQHELASGITNLVEQFTAIRAEMRHVRDELVSNNGVRRRGALARPIVNGASMKISVSPGQLAGYSLAEAAGAAAVVRLRDGIDAGGDVLARINLAANGYADRWFLPHGIAFTAGLYVEVVSGAIEGAVYLGPTGP